MDAGVRAVGGAAAGPVHLFSRDEDLRGIPEAAVVVARQPMARLVLVMPRINAIVTERGNPTEEETQEVMERVGLVIAFSRQLDLALVSDAIRDRCLDAFRTEDYRLSCLRPGSGQKRPISCVHSGASIVDTL